MTSQSNLAANSTAFSSFALEPTQKEQEALDIRDVSLIILKSLGQIPKGLGPNYLSYEADGLHILYGAYDEPFLKPPPRDASLRRIRPPNLHYGLDIWSGPKVLNLEWTLEGLFYLTRYERGSWRNKLNKFYAASTSYKGGASAEH